MTPETRQAIERNRDELEILADSDLPVSWIGDELLEAADPAEG